MVDEGETYSGIGAKVTSLPGGSGGVIYNITVQGSLVTETELFEKAKKYAAAKGRLNSFAPTSLNYYYGKSGV
jgi:hypothetical protein